MADTTDPEPPRKTSRLRIALLLLIGAALAGGGFAAGHLMSGPRLSPTEEALRLLEEKALAAGPDAADAEPIYFEFQEKLLSNLSGSRHMVQIGVGVSTRAGQEVIDAIETHRMALRSDMLAVMSGFAVETVEGAEGRARLAAALRDRLDSRLQELSGVSGLESVYFTSFLVQ
jgi:flagellar FliL protein